jgi:penicillin-binding protein 1A
MTLTQALTHSINTVAVRLSVMIGNGNAKAGRAKIIATARRMGIVTPLPDTPSLPIGADAVTVIEHTAAYATFPNEGKAVTPHTILEVRTGAGDLVWRFDRDGQKPVQAISPKVAHDMAMMMSHVVEEGTARRAQLDGIPAAGKTGTTNNFRDAWFVGYTGNLVCGVWFGNDDYATMNKMTGGSIPAQTWHQIMAYAHQGIELKPIPGVPEVPKARPAAAQAAADGETAPQRPPTLTRRGAERLVAIERLLDDAAQALAASAPPAAVPGTDRRAALPRDTEAPLSDQQALIAASRN